MLTRPPFGILTFSDAKKKWFIKTGAEAEVIYFAVEICNKVAVAACTNEVIVVANCSTAIAQLTENDRLIADLSDKAIVIGGSKR